MNSLNIVRVQEELAESFLPSERIKFKLVFSDYYEVKASNQENTEIRITTQNKASIIEVLTNYFPVKFYAPNSIWQKNEHNFSFLGYLDQGRYLMEKKTIELKCQSRLSKYQKVN